MEGNDLVNETAVEAADGRSGKFRAPRIRVHYTGAEMLCEGEALAKLRFVQRASSAAQRRHEPLLTSTPLIIDIALPILGTSSMREEVWLANGPVRTGQSGSIGYAHDDYFLFGRIELEERIHGGILSATEAAYAAISRFQQQSPFAHLLRVWNYLDSINEGSGDLERYRQFCVGRAKGLEASGWKTLPAATAVGRQESAHQLQIFWIASNARGTVLENPRQVSAYRYPRMYGPKTPNFSRATVTSDGTVLVSGTASIVGHVSRHPGDPIKQLEETILNLSSLRAHARKYRGEGRSDRDLFKVYLRDPEYLEPIAAQLKECFPQGDAMFLAADICRRELLVEIEALWSAEV